MYLKIRRWLSEHGSVLALLSDRCKIELFKCASKAEMKRKLDLSQRHPLLIAEVFEVQRVSNEYEPRSSAAFSERLFPRWMRHPLYELRILLSSK